MGSCRRYECRPESVTEAEWLVGPRGPFFDDLGQPRAGEVHHDGRGLVTLDELAMMTLRLLPLGEDGSISDDDGPAIVFGTERWPILPAETSCAAGGP